MNHHVANGVVFLVVQIVSVIQAEFKILQTLLIQLDAVRHHWMLMSTLDEFTEHTMCMQRWFLHCCQFCGSRIDTWTALRGAPQWMNLKYTWSKLKGMIVRHPWCDARLKNSSRKWLGKEEQITLCLAHDSPSSCYPQWQLHPHHWWRCCYVWRMRRGKRAG